MRRLRRINVVNVVVVHVHGMSMAQEKGTEWCGVESDDDELVMTSPVLAPFMLYLLILNALVVL